MNDVRSLYMVLSPASLPYARHAIESLMERSVEQVHLHLITDSDADREKLEAFMRTVEHRKRHHWNVYSGTDLAQREAERFADFPNLRAFRKGHPCWRKITDPLLLAEEGSEMVLLDPDLYFPNTFRFEPTPEQGILLMWQRPNCLLPHKTVRAAMDAGIPLARHVDIGVAQWRGPADLQWLDWLIGVLGGDALPRMMHVEAIVWAALAMRMGGGHLNPSSWHCWHRSQSTRILRLFRVEGSSLLRTEPWSTIKCFHGGGEAKHWLPEALYKNMFSSPVDRTAFTTTLPFIELTPSGYGREQSFKRLLRGLGYYSLFRTS